MASRPSTTTHRPAAAAKPTRGTGTGAPIFDDHKELEDNYNSLECRIGWDWLFGGNRHFAYYDKPESVWCPFPLSTAQARMQAKLFETLDLPPGSAVLDAGCGDGHVAIDAARRYGLRVTAFDVIDRHVANARKNVRDASLEDWVNVLRLDFAHLETIPDDSFDGVYMSEALLHAKDAPAVIAEFFRILKPGGHLALHEYHHDFMAKSLPGFPSQIAAAIAGPIGSAKGKGLAFPRAKKYFSKALEDAGFEDTSVQNYSANIEPMARMLSIFAIWRYVVVLFRLEKFFPNTAKTTEGYVGQEHWAYLAVGGKKPGLKPRPAKGP